MAFKKGNAVWLYRTDKATGYPMMYHRPGIITKRVHPTSFKVAFVASDPKQSQAQWKLDRRSHEHHPTELYPHYLDPGAELRRRRQVWKDETPIEVQEAHWKAEEDRKRASENLNRWMHANLARAFAKRRK